MKLPRLRFPRRSYVYVLNVVPESGLRPFLWVGKVGFSYDADIRAAEIERSIWQETGARVRVKTFFRVRVFMFRGIEKAVHAYMRPYQYRRFLPASGGTEFFRIINVVVGLLTYLACYAFGLKCAPWLSLCVMLAPWPLDMTLCVALLALMEYIAIGAGIWITYNLAVAILAT